MKHALFAAGLVLVGGLAAGCGGDDSSSSASDAPSSGSSSSSAAPTADFCSTLAKGNTINDGKDVADFADSLESTGAPSDIPADAKKGFDVYLGVLNDVDPSASAKELKTMKNVKLSKTEQTEVQSFFGYASTACAPASGGSGAGSPAPSQ